MRIIQIKSLEFRIKTAQTDAVKPVHACSDEVLQSWKLTQLESDRKNPKLIFLQKLL